jgi:hypothetical protein
MDKKKVLLIGTGIIAFGAVVFFVIRKFSGNKKSQPSGNKCPQGYIPKNGKCARITKSGVGANSGVYGGVYGVGAPSGVYTGGVYDPSAPLYTGYVSEPSGVYGSTSGQTILSTRSGSRLRKEPNTKSTIIKTYDKGVTLVSVGESNESDGLWYKVQEKSSINAADVKREGWMRSDVVDVI